MWESPASNKPVNLTSVGGVVCRALEGNPIDCCELGWITPIVTAAMAEAQRRWGDGFPECAAPPSVVGVSVAETPSPNDVGESRRGAAAAVVCVCVYVNGMVC